MFKPGDLVRCKMLSGIYTPLGIIIREANPTVYEVLVMHGPGPVSYTHLTLPTTPYV